MLGTVVNARVLRISDANAGLSFGDYSVLVDRSEYYWVLPSARFENWLGYLEQAFPVGSEQQVLLIGFWPEHKLFVGSFRKVAPPIALSQLALAASGRTFTATVISPYSFAAGRSGVSVRLDDGIEADIAREHVMEGSSLSRARIGESTLVRIEYVDAVGGRVKAIPA